jgi:tetratricopeptide (TPR) repeat protein
MVRTYDGLRDVAETRTAVARMAKDPAIRKLQAEEAKADQFEERFVRETLGSIGAIYAGLRQSEFKPTAADVRRALRVGDLQRMAAKDGAEGRAAKRLLASVFSQLAFYLRREFLARQEYQLGIISLQAAIEIHPERPVVWYNLGCLYALAGDRRHALDSIEKAISLGFNDAKLLASDQDLESIRDDARFKAALLAIPSQ